MLADVVPEIPDAVVEAVTVYVPADDGLVSCAATLSLEFGMMTGVADGAVIAADTVISTEIAVAGLPQ